jgi:acyl dehydratase
MGSAVDEKSASDESLLTEEALSWLGRTWTTAPREISAELIARHVAATGEQNPHYTDPDAARSAGYSSVIAPPMLYRTLARPIVPLADLTVDGVTEDRRPPVGQGRAMNGEVSVEFVRPLIAGDRITAECTLTELTEKQGRRARFVLATWRTEFRDQRGSLVITEISKNVLM